MIWRILIIGGFLLAMATLPTAITFSDVFPWLKAVAVTDGLTIVTVVGLGIIETRRKV